MQYWPASKEKDETHGGISISILHEEELANFHIRTFLLAKKEEGAVSLSYILLRSCKYKGLKNTVGTPLFMHVTDFSHKCTEQNSLYCIFIFLNGSLLMVGTKWGCPLCG
jgi:hypothetical protein